MGKPKRGQPEALCLPHPRMPSRPERTHRRRESVAHEHTQTERRTAPRNHTHEPQNDECNAQERTQRTRHIRLDSDEDHFSDQGNSGSNSGSPHPEPVQGPSGKQRTNPERAASRDPGGQKRRLSHAISKFINKDHKKLKSTYGSFLYITIYDGHLTPTVRKKVSIRFIMPHASSLDPLGPLSIFRRPFSVVYLWTSEWSRSQTQCENRIPFS